MPRRRLLYPTVPCCCLAGFLFVLVSPLAAAASQSELDMFGKDAEWLHGSKSPQLALLSQLKAGDWKAQTDLSDAINDAESTLTAAEDAWLRLGAETRWEGIGLDLSATSGIGSTLDELSYGIAGALVVYPDLVGAAGALRFTAQYHHHKADARIYVNTIREDREVVRRQQRYTLEIEMGEQELAGLVSGFFYEHDRIPSVVTFLNRNTLQGYAAFDEDLELDKWGVFCSYDMIRGRRWRRVPYLGPFFQVDLAGAWVSYNPSAGVRRDALQATNATSIERRGLYEISGRLAAGALWQQDLGKPRDSFLQIALGAEWGGSLTLSESFTGYGGTDLLSDYDLWTTAWSLFGQANWFF